MVPAGYLYKKVMPRTDWLASETVKDCYSVSSCISPDFCDYVPHWRHNGYWLFDTPHIMQAIAAEAGIDLAPMTLFYYELHEREYREQERRWAGVAPDDAFETRVVPPLRCNPEGFDVVSFWAGNTPECSPLSCNGLAARVRVNEHCLLVSLEEAIARLEAGTFDGTEPGPFRILSVATLAPAMVAT